MAERIWDRFLTERDKAVFAAAGYGARGAFPSRPALLIVDVSYGFCGDRPEPILDSIKRWAQSCGEEAWQAIGVIRSLAAQFRARRMPVIYTTGVMRADGWDAGSWTWKNTRTTESAPRPARTLDPNQIVAEIAPQPQDIVVLKQKPSGFFGSPLQSYLQLLGCDGLVVTGTTTSGCVRATVIDAFSMNYRVAVAEEACFDRSQASHALSLCDMNAKYADVLPAAEIVEAVRALPEDLFPNLPKGAGDPLKAAA